MTRRSRPPVYRGKNIARGFKRDGRKHWQKQRLAAILHFRRQPEEEISLADDNKEETYVYELVLEDNSLLITEDGNFNFLYNPTLNFLYTLLMEDDSMVRMEDTTDNVLIDEYNY